MTTRRGSFLLVCIGMMSLMMIIGFAMLRNIQLQTDTSTINQRVLLVPSRGQGRPDACDRADPQGLPRARPSRSSPMRAVGAARRAFARSSTWTGPNRAPFIEFHSPNYPEGEGNEADANDDVRQEHPPARAVHQDQLGGPALVGEPAGLR